MLADRFAVVGLVARAPLVVAPDVLRALGSLFARALPRGAFRSAFAGRRREATGALLLVPVALLGVLSWGAFLGVLSGAGLLGVLSGGAFLGVLPGAGLLGVLSGGAFLGVLSAEGLRSLRGRPGGRPLAVA